MPILILVAVFGAAMLLVGTAFASFIGDLLSPVLDAVGSNPKASLGVLAGAVGVMVLIAIKGK